MIYKILKSGSKGNAVILNDYILIDCGVPFKALQEYYRKFEIVLLTHIHSDHFNKTTIRRLADDRPTLRFACGSWLVNDLIACGVNKRNIDLMTMRTKNDYGKFSVTAFHTKHNVDNCCFMFDLKRADTRTVFYATDCNTLDGIQAPNMDLYMIEANYKESEISERIADKKLNGEYAYELEVIKNHLSYEKACNWIYENAGSNSEYIFLHKHEG